MQGKGARSGRGRQIVIRLCLCEAPFERSPTSNTAATLRLKRGSLSISFALSKLRSLQGSLPSARCRRSLLGSRCTWLAAKRPSARCRRVPVHARVQQQQQELREQRLQQRRRRVGELRLHRSAREFEDGLERLPADGLLVVRQAEGERAQHRTTQCWRQVEHVVRVHVEQDLRGGSTQAHHRFTTGSAQAQHRLNTGSTQIHHRLDTGSSQAQHRLNTDSAQALDISSTQAQRRLNIDS